MAILGPLPSTAGCYGQAIGRPFWSKLPDPSRTTYMYSRDRIYISDDVTSSVRNSHKQLREMKKYKNGTMQIYSIMTRGNGKWYLVLNNHEPHAHCMHCTHHALHTACIAHTMHCTLHAVHTPCIAHCMQCTHHALHTACIAHTMHCTLHAVHTPCIAHCMHCTHHALHTACSAHTMHCTLHAVHTPCIAHTVYSWPHGRSLCVHVPIIMYIAHAWRIPFQNFVSTIKLVYGIRSITLYLSISSC